MATSIAAAVGSRSQERRRAEALERLTESSIESRDACLALLERLQEESIPLRGRRTARGAAEEARVVSVGATMKLETRGMAPGSMHSMVLSFDLDGRSFSFVAVPIRDPAAGQLEIELPAVIYRSERRDRQRRPVDRAGPTRVLVGPPRDERHEMKVLDVSPTGLGLRSREGVDLAEVRSVRFLDGDLGGETRWAEIRHEELDEQRGWKKLGLKISEVPHVGWHAVEERRSIGSRGALSAVGDRIRIAAGMFGGAARRLVAPAPDPVSVEVADFCNARGETIRGILNTTPSPRGGTAVVIPPAWGRTKETLLPLALTIVDAFRRAGKPAAVFRFDGTRRRGESYNDPDCLVPGHDHDRFRISEAVENILDVTEFLTRCPRIEARRVVLVTFSAASIEGRRAVQLDAGRRICGWVSVVGTPDLQSGMRMVSGGIDYFGGAERGVRFGRQEIMGVATDIDQIAEDALEHRLVFLEDARRDMADIRVPVSWIHGRNDAWLDLGRVREIMGCGERGNRSLVSVPTGHQLRSSLEALDVFRLVAREAGRLSTGRDFPEARPALASIESARRAERERIKLADVDLRAFWDSYLLGREGHLGIELMNETSSYRHLMDLQIRMLEMAPGQRVCDAGAGTGPFPLALAERRPPDIELALIDFVPSALKRARERVEGSGLDLRPAYVVADLAGRAEVPLRTESMDRILASLLVSYVPEPQLLLEKLRGLLKPGGRLVVSSLRADADVSKLYVSGIEELKRGRAREVFGALGEREVASGARRFLNDAARVLDLEEDGHFRFWEERDFCRLVESAGFRVLDVARGFGDPEQAIVVAAERP